MKTYNKPHLNYTEQINKMKARGLLFREEALAEHILQYVQYYRFSGYLHHFKEVDSTDPDNHQRLDTYVKGVYFEDVFQLYRFDKKLRILILDAIETIEIALRSQISYELGMENPYILDEERLFKNNSEFNSFCAARENYWENSTDVFAKYMKKAYSNKPIWVETETWTMGMMSDFLNMIKTDFFRSSSDNRYLNISKKLGAHDIHVLARWSKATKFLRNKCAHHGRIWNTHHQVIKFKRHEGNYNSPYVQAYLSAYDSDCGNNRLYFQFLMIWQMLRHINPNSQWHERLKQLIDNDFPQGVPHVALSNMGFPDNWKEQTIWE